MSERTYSVGIVGCGGMGRAHAGAYEATDGVEVVAAADLDPEARDAFGEEHGVATYESHADLLAEADPDVLSVCTLHSTHARIAIDAAEAGVEGVFCEKPLATSAGETRDILDAADRNDVTLVVGHQRRFAPVHERARDLVQSGEIGEVRTITTRKAGGLLNWGTHLIDMARYLLDDPDYEWVMGQVERTTDRHERGLALEDRCLGQVCFADGTRLTHESDMPGPDYGDATMEVAGSDGVLHLHLGEKVTVVNADGETTYDSSDLSPVEAAGQQRADFVEAFVECMDGERDAHRCSGEQAAAVMEVMMALYESARTRGVVEAPLETRANPLLEMIESGDLPVEHPGAYDIRIPYASVRED